jgi:hypothetical protein
MKNYGLYRLIFVLFDKQAGSQRFRTDKAVRAGLADWLFEFVSEYCKERENAS